MGVLDMSHVLSTYMKVIDYYVYKTILGGVQYDFLLLFIWHFLHFSPNYKYYVIRTYQYSKASAFIFDTFKSPININLEFLLHKHHTCIDIIIYYVLSYFLSYNV